MDDLEFGTHSSGNSDSQTDYASDPGELSEPNAQESEEIDDEVGPNGFIDSCGVNEIIGWVITPDLAHCPVVSLWQGEDLVAETNATETREDLAAIGVFGYGFDLRVKGYSSSYIGECQLYIDGKFWQTIADVHLESDFEEPVLLSAHGFIHGILRRRRETTPWPTLVARPQEAGVLAEVELLQSLDPLQLQIKIRAHGSALLNAKIDLFANDKAIAEGIEVAVTPAAGRPVKRPVGGIDTFGPHFITGWMLGTSPDERAFDVLIDGRHAGSGQANRPRQDVEETFGVADTAFAWPIPKRFKDGAAHDVTIRRRSDGKELRGSGESRSFSGGNSISLEAGELGLTVQVRVTKSLPLAHLQLWLDDDVLSVYPLVLIPEDSTFSGSICLAWDDLLGGINRRLSVNLCEYSLSREIDGAILLNQLGPLRGSVDQLASGQLRGWIGYPAAPELSVPIQVLVDGQIIGETIADGFRPDVAAAGFAKFNHGFRVDVPRRLMTGQVREAAVRCAITGQMLASTLRTFYPQSVRLRRLHAEGDNAFDKLSRRLDDRAPRDAPATAKLATIIILTRDGQQVLRKCLESLHRFLPPGLADVVIVDHNSQDETSALLDEYHDVINIREVKLSGNGSFSRSNNEIAFLAETPYVVFVNNDVVLLSDAIGSLIATLANDPTIGAVGCKLIEAREGFDAARVSVHHAGIALQLDGDGYVKAREIHDELAIAEANRPIDVYGATGALLAMRTGEFREIGGFPQHYFYGGEDVELSVLVHTRLKKRVVCRNDVVALHYRGYARLSHRGAAILPRVHENERLLNQRIGYYNRKRYQASILLGGNNDSLYRGIIGFICMDAGPFTRSGEYFTALELAREYAALSGCDTVFITPDSDWYDLDGIDCLVVMLHEYDLSQIRNRAPHMTLIIWARNHFDTWLTDERLTAADLVLASSASFCDALLEQRGLPAKLLKIATNPSWAASGTMVGKFRADAIFNGSHAGAQREFGASYDADLFQGELKVVGAGWEDTPSVAASWVGAADYASMPDVYASTRIVIDDANVSARAWGGTNSRVFDALAAGCLVISNSPASSEADFAGRLPTWETMADLADTLNFFTANPAERDRLATELQQVVVTHHTYRQRAAELREYLRAMTKATRIAIKIGAPNLADIEQWGDWHFAQALAGELRALGYCVWIDPIDRWYDRSRHADVALVLRGLTAYHPMPDQINIMWLISHPDAVAASELERYDHVFVAAPTPALIGRSDVSSSSLLQFSAFDTPDPDAIGDEALAPLLAQIGRGDIVFVGNTRSVRREFVLAVHQRHGVKFIGRGWDLHVSPDDILAEYVDNAALPLIYHAAGCVVNDHWPDMREAGIISNRIFDVAAAGGFMLSDYSAAGAEIFGGEQFCQDIDDFSGKWQHAQADDDWRQAVVDRAQGAAQNHRASTRAAVIDAQIGAIHQRIMSQGVRKF